MKNSLKKSEKNNSSFVNFQTVVIDSSKQKMVKGGSDIITQDVLDG